MAAKIPVVYEAVCKTAENCITEIQKIGFPVVMKVVGPIHKSDVGGVITNIKNDEDTRKAFNNIMQTAKKLKVKPEGVLIQKMASGTEIIIGLKQDPQFGPTVLLGLGGIFVEIMKDISLRIAPLTKEDCIEMIDELKGNAILKGARGKKHNQ